jgi:putative endonuclease
VAAKTSDAWYVYIIQSDADHSLYTGISKDPWKRLKAHNAGKGAKRTRGRGPWRLVGFKCVEGKSSALIDERSLKKESRAMKLQWCKHYAARERA